MHKFKEFIIIMRKVIKQVYFKLIIDKGGYYGILGVSSTSISVIIAFLLYTSVNPTFTVMSNSVSDLGTGPNMSNIVYNVGATLSGFCLLFYHLSIVKNLQNKKVNTYLIKITKFTSIISASGLIVLGIIPFEKEMLTFFLGHGSAAATHYVAGSFTFFFYGFFEIFILKHFKIYGIISFLTSIIYGMLWIGYLIDFIFQIPQVYVNFILQWISLAGIVLWSIFHSIFFFQFKKYN